MRLRAFDQPATFAVAFVCMLPQALPEWKPAAAVPAAAGSPTPAAAANPCPRDPIDPDRVIEGEFDSEYQGSYVMVPFDVPQERDRRPRQVLLRPAREREPGEPHGRPGPVGARAERAGLGTQAVPRLGRLEPSRRDGLATRVLE